jgi:hypothetical protein
LAREEEVISAVPHEQTTCYEDDILSTFCRLETYSYTLYIWYAVGSMMLFLGSNFLWAEVV